MGRIFFGLGISGTGYSWTGLFFDGFILRRVHSSTGSGCASWEMSGLGLDGGDGLGEGWRVWVGGDGVVEVGGEVGDTLAQEGEMPEGVGVVDGPLPFGAD